MLLGGFGAFALWQHAGEFGAEGTLATGRLTIESVESHEWRFYGDVDGNHDGVFTGDVIEDVDDFRVSPGDVLQWSGTATFVAEGSDLRAQFGATIDPVVHPDLREHVEVTVDVGGEGAGPIVVIGDATGDPQTVDLTVSVAFARDFGDDGTHGQAIDAAVSLDKLALTLTQVAGQQPATD